MNFYLKFWNSRSNRSLITIFIVTFYHDVLVIIPLWSTMLNQISSNPLPVRNTSTLIRTEHLPDGASGLGRRVRQGTAAAAGGIIPNPA